MGVAGGSHPFTSGSGLAKNAEIVNEQEVLVFVRVA